MTTPGTPRSRQPGSPRAAIAAALAALLAAERTHAQAVKGADTARDDHLKRAAGAETLETQRVTAAATTKREAIKRGVADSDRLRRQAEAAVQAAAITLPATPLQVTVGPTQRGPDQELQASQHELQTAAAALGHALQELERVRGTLLVRALRKVGLPPL